MMLYRLNDLDEKTKDEIAKEQRRLWTGEITSIEFDEKYEAIMQRWRMEAEKIMQGKIKFSTIRNET